MQDDRHILSLVKIENIDCKKIMFKDGAPTFTDGETTYFDAELVIIKNAEGREVFNSLVSRFHWRDNQNPLEDVSTFPFYAVTFDMFAGGYHYGKWRYYDSLENLGKDFETDSMEDDFQRFERDMGFFVRQQEL